MEVIQRATDYENGLRSTMYNDGVIVIDTKNGGGFTISVEEMLPLPPAEQSTEGVVVFDTRVPRATAPVDIAGPRHVPEDNSERGFGANLDDDIPF